MAKPRGLTLIELMLVVVIVGSLSTLSVMGYRKVISKSRVTEGMNTVNGIKIAQDQYFSETGTYASPGWATFCPQNQPKAKVADHSVWKPSPYGWNPACNSGTGAWGVLPFTPDGAVRFGVVSQRFAAGAVTALAIPSSSGNINGTAITWPANSAKPWYAIAAISDLNGDASATEYTTVFTTSLNTQIWVDKEGE